MRLPRCLAAGWRMLDRNRGTSFVAIVALAVGIGLATAVFSILNGLLLRDLPVDRGEDLMYLYRPPNRPFFWITPRGYQDYRAGQSTFEDLAAFRLGSMNLADDDAYPERYEGCHISHRAFRILRLEPALGRFFTAEDDLPGAPPRVLLAHHVFEQHFAGDPGVLGRIIRINGEAAEVIGVLPPGVRFPTRQEIYLPLRLDPGRFAPGEGPRLGVFGRLREGVGRAAAQADIAAVTARIHAERGGVGDPDRIDVRPYTAAWVGPRYTRFFWNMQAAAILVLLIACTKAGSLLLVHALASRRDLAIRAALGARRVDVMGQILAEAFWLTLLGALGGLVLAVAGCRFFVFTQGFKVLPYWMRVTIDGEGFAFAVLVGLITALLAGSYPAWRAARDAAVPAAALYGTGRGSTGHSGRALNVLIALDVALATALILPTMLLIRSVVQLDSDSLMMPAETLSARLDLPPADYPDDADRAALAQRLRRALEERADVETAAVTTHLPTYDRAASVSYEIEGRDSRSPEDLPSTLRAAVTPHFFATLGVPVLNGRVFNSQDRAENPAVVVVNRSFAQAVWGGESPIGRRLRISSGSSGEEPWRSVVGVVEDAWLGYLEDDAQAGFYLPFAQAPAASWNVVVRVRGDPSAFAETLRRELRRLDAGLPIFRVWTGSFVIKYSRSNFETFTGFFASLGFAALILASLGLFGGLAYSVSRRVPEIGLRMAVGATRADVVRGIVLEGMRPFAVGLVAGVVLAVITRDVVAGFLFGVEPADPLTFLPTATAFTAVALLACLIPAWRAARLEPSTALRHE